MPFMKNRGEQTRPWRGLLWRLPFLLLLPAGLLLPRFAAGHAAWIESVYCASLYPPVKDALSAFTSLVPFSVAELLLYGVCVFVPLLLIVYLIRAFAKRRWRQLVSLLLSLAILAGGMITLFYPLWGLCYFRAPLAARMELPVRERGKEELYALTCFLAREAASVRDTLAEDGAGVFAVPGDAEDSFDALIPAYASLSAALPVFSGKVTRAKPVLWSEGLSWAGIAGIYIGFTAEPNVNVDQPDLLIPAGAAHEMAHQLGIASENEAEFVSYLACTHADVPAIRYSGLMHALIACGNALYGADAALFAEAAQLYSDGMRRDLAAYNAYWDAFEGPVEEYATATNDNYLKHNQQESGVKSYGEVVDLLLAWHSAENA